MTNLCSFLLIALPVIRSASVWSFAIAFILSLPVFLIGLEVMPKKLFRRYPFRSLRAVSPLVHIVGLARPIFRTFATHPNSAEISQTPSESRQTRGREDLKSLAQELAAQHQLSSTATHLIERVLDYKKLCATDVMLPLSRSIALAAEMTLNTALIIAREQNTSLLPVLGEGGDFIGMLDTSELPPSLPPDRLVRQHMRTLDTVSAVLPALHVLQRMRKKGRRLTIVVDERHAPLGLITEERLLEPLMR